MDSPNSQPPKPKLRWNQFSLRGLLVLTTLVAVVLSAAQMLGSRVLILQFVWLILLLTLMAAGARAGGGPKRRWAFACCEALAAIYGPFVVAAANTWLFDGGNSWLHADLWKLLLVVPGAMHIELVAVTVWRQNPGCSETMYLVLSGLASVLILATGVLLAAKTRLAKWVALPFMDILCAFGAIFLDAGMRM